MPNDQRILVGIPTRDRPAYLSCLLSSLIFQTDVDFDVLIVDTAIGEQYLGDDSMVLRFVDTLRALGHKVSILEVDVAGKSEAAAVNRILVEAFLSGYGFVYKVDDDHILPPDALEKLRRAHTNLRGEHPVLLSGVTPWMFEAYEGASSPYDPPVDASEIGLRGVTFVRGDKASVDVEIGHFCRYNSTDIVRTELASAANFFLQPDIRILWSDVCGSSKYADAVWFLQLRKLLQYRMYFLLSLNVWHVAAPTGGVREELGDFDKSTKCDFLREQILMRVCKELGVGNEN